MPIKVGNSSRTFEASLSNTWSMNAYIKAWNSSRTIAASVYNTWTMIAY